jgi:hypothetical protein
MISILRTTTKDGVGDLSGKRVKEIGFLGVTRREKSSLDDRKTDAYLATDQPRATETPRLRATRLHRD